MEAFVIGNMRCGLLVEWLAIQVLETVSFVMWNLEVYIHVTEMSG
jgi:hypothetical protein